MATIWDSAAPGWEANAEFVDVLLGPATEEMLDLAGVTDGTDVLDLAAGPGGAGIAAARRVGPRGSVMLSDVSPEMMAVAARRASADSRVSTAVFEQNTIPLEAASFDAIINRHGLMFVEDPLAAATEAVRVLRPGGRYATMTWDRRELNLWLGLVLDAVGEQFGIAFPPPSVHGPFSLDNVDDLSDVLSGAGLSDVSVVAMAAPMRVASLDEWWGRVPKLAGPLAMALAGMDADVREAIADRAMRAAGAAAQDADGIVFPGSVLIGAGRRPDLSESS